MEQKQQLKVILTVVCLVALSWCLFLEPRVPLIFFVSLVVYSNMTPFETTKNDDSLFSDDETVHSSLVLSRVIKQRAVK
jgi:NADH:ubiquinone oxidoreductase subunit H